MDTNTTLRGNQTFTFIGSAGFDNHAGELRYEKTTAILYGDVNGDGVADFWLHFSSGTALRSGDIIL